MSSHELPDEGKEKGSPGAISGFPAHWTAQEIQDAYREAARLNFAERLSGKDSSHESMVAGNDPH